MGFIVTKGLQKRKCHLCREPIPKTEVHIRFRFPSQLGKSSYINLCQECVDPLRALNKGYGRSIGWIDGIVGPYLKKTLKREIRKGLSLDEMLDLQLQERKMKGVKDVYRFEWTKLGKANLRKVSHRRHTSSGEGQGVAGTTRRFKRKVVRRKARGTDVVLEEVSGVRASKNKNNKLRERS